MRCWLVDRTYDDKGLVRLVYATEDGGRAAVRERSSAMLERVEVTAAVELDPSRLEPVDDAAVRERYAAEAKRMRERHEPDEPV